MRAMSLTTPPEAITSYGGVAFLIVSLLAAVIGLGDIGAVAAIAWVLSVVALITAMIFVVLDRRGRLWLRRLARHRLVRGAGRGGCALPL